MQSVFDSFNAYLTYLYGNGENPSPEWVTGGTTGPQSDVRSKRAPRPRPLRAASRADGILHAPTPNSTEPTYIPVS